MVTKHDVYRKQGERGFTILFYSLMIFVVLGFTGLAVDAGYLQWQQRLMQSAADAGAMGALREMELGRTNLNPTNDLTTAAQNDAALNGFTNGTNDITVSLNNPPTSGAFQGQTTAAQVIISRPYPTFFMRILGTNTVRISAQAVAQTTTSYGSIGGCIFALNPTANNALTETGGTTVVNTSCSAVSESDSTSGAYVMSGGNVWNFTSHNAHIGVVGGYTVSGGSTIYDTTLTPKAAENPVKITSPGDPLINAATPTTSNVAVTTIQATSGSYDSSHMPTGNKLSPGVYCNGITISSTGGQTIMLGAGVYILAGGGLTVSSSAVLAGTGVMFYNTTGSWGSICPSNSYPVKPMTVSGGGTTNLSAPTSGTWCGMLFYEDRSLSNQNNAVTGGSSTTMNGALYFKKSKLTFSGGSSGSGGYTVLVADTITISGGSTIGNNYTSLSDPNPFAPGATGAGLVY